jgi:hypothetical protein
MARHAGGRLSGIADRRRRQRSQTVRPGKDHDLLDSKGSRPLRRDRAVEQDQRRKSGFLLKREKTKLLAEKNFARRCGTMRTFCGNAYLL